MQLIFPKEMRGLQLKKKLVDPLQTLLLLCLISNCVTVWRIFHIQSCYHRLGAHNPGKKSCDLQPLLSPHHEHGTQPSASLLPASHVLTSVISTQLRCWHRHIHLQLQQQTCLLFQFCAPFFFLFPIHPHPPEGKKALVKP